METYYASQVTKANNRVVNLLVFMGLLLFLFHEPIRSILSKNVFFRNYHLLFFVIGALLILQLLIKENIDLRIILVTIAFTGLAVISLQSQSSKITNYLKIIISISLPFLITGFRLSYPNFINFYTKFLKIFNAVCIFVVIIGISDYLVQGAIQSFMVNHNVFGAEIASLVMIEKSSGIYRYYSIIGHPLQNAWYLLIFYVLNVLSGRYFKPVLNEYIVSITVVIGLLLSGSRTALVIGLFMVIFVNNRKYKLAYVFAFAVASLGIWNTKLFQENLLKRFIIGFISNDISEGRNLAVMMVLNRHVKSPEILTGGGIGYSREITMMMGSFINSFEYPLMMFVYDFGILGTLLIYIMILLIPTLIFLKNKHYFILIQFWAISLYINGFNDLANYSDFMGQLCFLIMILVNISYIKVNYPEKS